MSSLLETVWFDVYGTTYDTTNRIKVRAAVAEITGVQGHFEKVRYDREGGYAGAEDSNRAVGYILQCTLTTEQEALLEEGKFVKITHRKHPITKAKTALSPAVQYKVDKIDEPVPGTLRRTLHLLDKDES